MRASVTDAKAKFEDFLAERMPVLVEFAKTLGSSQAHRILHEPHLFLRGISDWLEHQEVWPEDRVWVITRLGYFVGEYLVMKYGGLWLVEDRESSRYFGRYVVGRFARIANHNAVADPFEVATTAVSPEAPSLQILTAEVCHALETA
jgi:hypothetical protein